MTSCQLSANKFVFSHEELHRFQYTEWLIPYQENTIGHQMKTNISIMNTADLADFM